MDTPNRVNYFERQFLRTDDFRDEQAYHIAMRRRHNIGQHTWGIVRGLELLFDKDGQQFYVQPGLAVDGYGRELLLPERLAIGTRVFDELGSDWLEVNLYYGLDPGDPPPRGYVEYDDNSRYYRAQERVFMRLLRPQPGADPRCPSDVPAGDQDFNPARTPPDSPLNKWPVFVGQIVRDSERDFSVVPVGRPYAGLVGEFITTPSRRARLVVGDIPPEQDSPNSRRFAVFLDLQPEAGTCPTPPDENQAELQIVTGKLIREDDQQRLTTQVDIRGETTVEGNVSIVGGALQVEAEDTVPGYAQPWRVYRVSKGSTHELRIEMSDETDSQVVIGVWSAKDKQFKPCLTVKQNGDVIIAGNLTARDFKYSQNHVTSVSSVYRPGLTPEARAAVSGALMTGIAGAVYRPYALRRAEAIKPPLIHTAQTKPPNADAVVEFMNSASEAEVERILTRLNLDQVKRVRTISTRVARPPRPQPKK